jgi:hypothetical protein
MSAQSASREHLEEYFSIVQLLETFVTQMAHIVA